MKRFSNISDWLHERDSIKKNYKSIGFVPTMGALHSGHISLVQRSLKENDLTMVSIFVNPTQFNDPKDLESYPAPLAHDLKLLKEAQVSYVLTPSSDELYQDGYRYVVSENCESKGLCGEHRPGHFNGVLTVVMKLLNLVQADRAYFGEKDYQQLQLIDGMVKSFFLTTKIIGCETIREHDGLAMSSRNIRLSPEERKLAAHFPRVLNEAESAEKAVQQLEYYGFNVDYIEDRLNRRFGAIKIGSVRLIDNVSR